MREVEECCCLCMSCWASCISRLSCSVPVFSSVCVYALNSSSVEISRNKCVFLCICSSSIFPSSSLCLSKRCVRVSDVSFKILCQCIVKFVGKGEGGCFWISKYKGGVSA